MIAALVVRRFTVQPTAVETERLLELSRRELPRE